MELDKSKVKVTTAGGVATCVYEDDNAFFDTDISKTQIKEVFKHNEAYVEACANMSAELSTDIMKKDKKVNDVIVKMPFGVSKRDSVTAKAKRTVTYPGIGSNPEVTRSDLQMVVKTGMVKMSKTKLKDLRAGMTEALLS